MNYPALSQNILGNLNLLNHIISKTALLRYTDHNVMSYVDQSGLEISSANLILRLRIN